MRERGGGGGYLARQERSAAHYSFVFVLNAAAE